MIQLQTIELAQQYFGAFIETVRQEVKESRAILQALPRQVPWRQEESFQVLFQELIENYAVIEKSLDQGSKNVTNSEAEQVRTTREPKATPIFQCEARVRSIDLKEVKDTGPEGRYLVKDVRRATKDTKSTKRPKRERHKPQTRNSQRHQTWRLVKKA